MLESVREKLSHGFVLTVVCIIHLLGVWGGGGTTFSCFLLPDEE